MITLLASVLAVTPAWAQGGSTLKTLWGKPTPTAVYIGMLTEHVRYLTNGFDGTALLALNFRGWIGGTFVNSYGHRSWTIGLQRDWFRTSLRETGAQRSDTGCS